MARGSKPGERRGGRQKGTPNKASVEIKDVARQYSPKAIEQLAKLAGLDGGKGAKSEQARIRACELIIERAHGKATQLIAGDDTEAPINVNHGALDQIISRVARLSARQGTGEDPERT